MQIRSFNEISSFDFTAGRAESIKQEIQSKSKEYIIGVEEETFKSYLFDKYKLEILHIDYGSESFAEPRTGKEYKTDTFYNERYEVLVYTFTISYRFAGSAELFSIHPPTYSMTSTKINVDKHKNVVSFDFKLFKQDAEEFRREKESIKNRGFY